MPRTLREGLTLENLNESIDEVIKSWTAIDEQDFIDRYTNAQFGHAGAHPRATIPAQADDDDLILARLTDLARGYFQLLQTVREYIAAADKWAATDAFEVLQPLGLPRFRRTPELEDRDACFAVMRKAAKLE